MLRRITRAVIALAAAGTVVTTVTAALAATPAMSPGFILATFAAGTGVSAATKGPDPILTRGSDTYVAYQNKSSKTGANKNPSTIVRYRTSDAVILGKWEVAGHCDGLRFNPSTGLLWASVNEDSGAVLYTKIPPRAPSRSTTSRARRTAVGTTTSGSWVALLTSRTQPRPHPRRSPRCPG